MFSHRSATGSGEQRNAYPMDSVANYYTPYKGQLAALPELQNYQPNEFFEQSHDESHLEYT